MIAGLTAQQRESRAAFRRFADEAIAPRADDFDREERLPPELVARLAREGYLGANVPPEYGGLGLDALTYGLLHEEVGRACSSVRSLLTVHAMTAHALQRWGTREQKTKWLPRLASGETVAAFGLTEPEVGSDARSVAATATVEGGSFVLDGRKKWVTFGQGASLFLVFAKSDGRDCAFLVERETPGLSVRPIHGMLGVRASMLAELHLEGCRVPRENLVGREGAGFSYVASTALDLGRYTVAWGCVGIGQACLEASFEYAAERKQFGVFLREHQLIQRMLTDMLAQVRAARLLCHQAGALREAGDPQSVTETSIAKYFASTVAARAAADAVQIQGARGCSAESPVQRYLRDAKIMEIIEGSTQMQQITIAQSGYQEHAL
ncbi:MAG TPA: acyl-CoA dehydrogenase family protein [Pyrinomonadaceae bacterium]|nr:acyl-CoA dehydrogenase family protein [Pyrinomonadaceae bacterium]